MNPERFEDASKFGGHFRSERAGQFFARDLDANDVAMVAHPELAEAQGANGVFSLLNHAECFARDLAAILNAGRETGRSGLVPDAQAGGAGKFTNFLLGESGVAQRRGNPVLFGGLLAGTEVALVVEVHAVSDGIEAPLARGILPSP